MEIQKWPQMIVAQNPLVGGDPRGSWARCTLVFDQKVISRKMTATYCFWKNGYFSHLVSRVFENLEK